MRLVLTTGPTSEHGPNEMMLGCPPRAGRENNRWDSLSQKCLLHPATVDTQTEPSLAPSWTVWTESLHVTCWRMSVVDLSIFWWTGPSPGGLAYLLVDWSVS